MFKKLLLVSLLLSNTTLVAGSPYTYDVADSVWFIEKGKAKSEKEVTKTYLGRSYGHMAWFGILENTKAGFVGHQLNMGPALGKKFHELYRKYVDRGLVIEVYVTGELELPIDKKPIPADENGVIVSGQLNNVRAFALVGKSYDKDKYVLVDPKDIFVPIPVPKPVKLPKELEKFNFGLIDPLSEN